MGEGALPHSTIRTARGAPGRWDGTQNERLEKASQWAWGHWQGSGSTLVEEDWGKPGQGAERAGGHQRASPGGGDPGAGEDGQAEHVAVWPSACCCPSSRLRAEPEQAWAWWNDGINRSQAPCHWTQSNISGADCGEALPGAVLGLKMVYVRHVKC